MPKIVIPPEYICPITLDLIEDPVTIDEDKTGQLYERRAMEEHFKKKQTIPYTNEIAQSKKLTTNFFAKKKINELLETNGLCTEKEFLDAVKSKNVKKVKGLYYLDKYLDAQDPTKDNNGFSNNTPLHLAAMGNDVRMLKFLMEEGATGTIKNSAGEPPLNSAARHGHLEAVSFLYEKTKDIESKNDKNISALSNAAYNGHINVVKFLISEGADIENIGCTQSKTPLLFAVMKGEKEVVEELIRAKANLSVKSNNNNTVLHLAVINKLPETLEILLRAISNQNREISNNNNEIQKEIYENDPNDNNNIHPEGAAVLLKASLTTLLEEKNLNQETPLISAVNVEAIACVILLLNFGANCNVRDKDGNTPLLLAINNNNVSLIEMLLARGADPKLKTSHGSSPLIMALKKEKIETAKFLIDKKIGLTESDDEGYTPLHWSAQLGQVELVKLLAANQENIDVKNKAGSTPLHLAASSGHQTIVSFLMESGAEYRLANNLGYSPDKLAATRGQIQMANFISIFHKQLKSKAIQSPKKIEELQQIIHQQQTKIDEQQEEIELLKKQLASLAETLNQILPREEDSASDVLFTPFK